MQSISRNVFLVILVTFFLIIGANVASAVGCCKTCTQGRRACGNICISPGQICSEPRGCACQGEDTRIKPSSSSGPSSAGESRVTKKVYSDKVRGEVNMIDDCPKGQRKFRKYHSNGSVTIGCE